ncbi:ABC transporter substrate-binding protein [Nocardia sp.]|uniref:ABC transporter substrate-binding protein n=1 Tax=Nocardia sp. TaxID=1821 RepID=UPI00262E2598|nr:extracellular solute-binding protein [Nocardia sp.]
MDALVAAAKKEGTLNLMALPRDWAGYGALMDNFGAKYGIKVNDDNPGAASADEINAIKSLKGQDRAPDAVDVGTSFAISGAKEGLYAPYKVSTWADIPDSQKDASGTWYGDYGGYISIGCDAAKVAVCPTTIADLAKPAYKGQVALSGDPLKSNSALMAVWTAALATGGSADSIQPGIDFFGKLKAQGNFVPVKATAATVQSGETPIIIDWDYLNAGIAQSLGNTSVKWTVAVSTDASIGGYYAQAISKTAPHPAAARLWQEYLYSDEGQNGLLKGFARPVRLPAMQKAGTVDPALTKVLPTASDKAVYPTDDQAAKAKDTLTQNWANTVK